MYKRTTRYILLAILLLMILGFCSKFILTLKQFNREIAAIHISKVDLSRIPDGEYIGRSESVWVKATVKVVVKKHVITDIRILQHENGHGKPAEKILKLVKAKQSLNVQAVTGATASSKIILQALERALLTQYPKAAPVKLR